MDPKENIPLSSAGEKGSGAGAGAGAGGSGGSAKSSLSMSAKSCKLSQKKCSPVENDSDINSVNPPADEKDRRENGSVSSGAKLGKETKKVPSLVSRVSDYLEDEESKASSAASMTVRRPASAPDASPAVIGKGLRINSMTMKDSDKNILLWAQNCKDTNLFDGGDYEAHLPASILQCSAVTRTINFSSFEKITSFSLIQKVILHGQCIEQWSFQFGFVIPGSTNSWEQTIFAAPRKEMLPIEVLSGNLVIETFFLNKEDIVAKTSMRIFYDA